MHFRYTLNKKYSTEAVRERETERLNESEGDGGGRPEHCNATICDLSTRVAH